MSRLRQMGRGSSSSLQAQTSAVAAIEFKYGYSVSTSEQKLCEYKETIMGKQCTKTIKTDDKSISITTKLRVKLGYLIVAALLVFGYGDGFSSSALVYSKS